MIIEIISKNTEARTPEFKQQFLDNFKVMYRLPILRPTLNLIATAARHGRAKFEIEPTKVWNRLAGHCQSEGFFSRLGRAVSRSGKFTIMIRDISPPIIMHEVAHAMEKEAAIDINADFRRVIGEDMGTGTSTHPQLWNAVENVMKNELKNYNLTNIMEELFARYFELIAMSHEVKGWGVYHFTYGEIVGYFAKTTAWVEESLNPLLDSMVEGDIRTDSEKIAQELGGYERKWADNVKSTFANDFGTRAGDAGRKWSASTRSIADWQKSWEHFSGESIGGQKKPEVSGLIGNEKSDA